MKTYLIIGAIILSLLVSNGYLYLTKETKIEIIKKLEKDIMVCNQNIEDIEVKKVILDDYHKNSYLQYLDMINILNKKEEKKDYNVVNEKLDFKSFFDELGGVK